jgi:hypothetical protein
MEVLRMLEWNTIENYNKDILVEVNIENGVRLPDVNKELLFERQDGVLFLGEFQEKNDGNFWFVTFSGGSAHVIDDVGLSDKNINGVKWTYINRAE